MSAHAVCVFCNDTTNTWCLAMAMWPSVKSHPHVVGVWGAQGGYDVKNQRCLLMARYVFAIIPCNIIDTILSTQEFSNMWRRGSHDSQLTLLNVGASYFAHFAHFAHFKVQFSHFHFFNRSLQRTRSIYLSIKTDPNSLKHQQVIHIPSGPI